MLRIGLMADTAAQLNVLRLLVGESGHQVVTTVLIRDFDVFRQRPGLPVDAWLVILPLESDGWAAIDSWLEQLLLPVIIDDGRHADAADADYEAWRRRVLKKLQQLHGAINLQRHPAGAAKTLWVLAGSTGGPKAVTEFFRALPAGLELGFVYVQHIDRGHERSLVEMITRHGAYPAFAVADGDVLRAGATAVIAGPQWVDFHSNGTVVVRAEKWPGIYSPSVDQVFANLARCFGARCNVMVFSGMGDDGAAGARLVHQQGGRVWAQQPQSCTISSMPDAVLATGTVALTGTPAQLAAGLAQLCGRPTATTGAPALPRSTQQQYKTHSLQQALHKPPHDHPSQAPRRPDPGHRK